jgi:hypothetical protein
MPKDKRDVCGLKGREWALAEGGLNAENMCKQFVTAMDYCFKNWKPANPIELVTSKDYVGNLMPDKKLGFTLPKIDVDKIQKNIESTIAKL